MAKKRRKNANKKLAAVGCLAGLSLLLLIPLALSFLLKKEKEEAPLPPINPYRAEDFVYENGRMTCLTTESVPGIDVSHYQGEIDWPQVRQSGIEFAFIRVAYRSAKDGVLYEDELARRNLEGAAAAGLRVGAYVFSQSVSPEDAVEEAEFAMAILKDHPLELPLVYDWETVSDNPRIQGMTRQVLMSCVEAFCQTVEKAGYQSMVYFNRDLSQTLLDVRKLSDTPVWFAMYHTYPDAPCKPDYWQYTDKGTVPGIEGYVDLNLYLP